MGELSDSGGGIAPPKKTFLDETLLAVAQQFVAGLQSHADEVGR